jgi:hypothetical protein
VGDLLVVLLDHTREPEATGRARTSCARFRKPHLGARRL